MLKVNETEEEEAEEAVENPKKGEAAGVKVVKALNEALEAVCGLAVHVDDEFCQESWNVIETVIS